MVQNQAVDNKIAYTVACVSSFAFAHNISKKEAFSYLYKNKAIEFSVSVFRKSSDIAETF